MHPCQAFPANQDEFPSWKSSLWDFSHKSGSISPLGIIPARYFLQIRIIFPDENHPSQIFPVNQDQFSRWKSSLPGISRESGWIPELEIIPVRFFPTNQDQSPYWKSSLPDISRKSGSFFPTKIIPAKAFHQIRINLPAENASPAALSGKSR